MFTIVGKQNLNSLTKRIDIRADDLVSRMRPGQFVTIMADAFSALKPFNVYDIDWRRKCLSIVLQETDETSQKLGQMKINDPLFAVKGPYGVPCPAFSGKTVLLVGEGMGLVSLVSLCRSFKEAKNKVIGIAGFESRKSSLLENQMRIYCNKFHVVYGDGTQERRGDVLAPLKRVLEEEEVFEIYAHTSLDMLREIYYQAWSATLPLKVNIMDLLQERPAFFDNTAVSFKGERYYPAIGGVFVDAALMDIHELTAETAALREYTQCRKRESALLAQRNVFARFKKFVWG
jgi:NAD(P)H-flavin reductase